MQDTSCGDQRSRPLAKGGRQDGALDSSVTLRAASAGIHSIG